MWKVFETLSKIWSTDLEMLFNSIIEEMISIQVIFRKLSEYNNFTEERFSLHYS